VEAFVDAKGKKHPRRYVKIMTCLACQTFGFGLNRDTVRDRFSLKLKGQARNRATSRKSFWNEHGCEDT